MAYDKTKDKLLTNQFGAPELLVDCSPTLLYTFGVYSYDGGVPKVRILKKTVSSAGKEYVEKLGSFNVAEFDMLMGYGKQIQNLFPKKE